MGTTWSKGFTGEAWSSATYRREDGSSFTRPVEVAGDNITGNTVRQTPTGTVSGDWALSKSEQWCSGAFLEAADYTLRAEGPMYDNGRKRQSGKCRVCGRRLAVTKVAGKVVGHKESVA